MRHKLDNSDHKCTFVLTNRIWFLHFHYFWIRNCVLRFPLSHSVVAVKWCSTSSASFISTEWICACMKRKMQSEKNLVQYWIFDSSTGQTDEMIITCYIIRTTVSDYWRYYSRPTSMPWCQKRHSVPQALVTLQGQCRRQVCNSTRVACCCGLVSLLELEFSCRWHW